MATIVKKLKDAGVRIPTVNQRVWQWVFDNGAHGANAVADTLKIPRNNASSTLGNLCDRGMMTRKLEKDQTGKDVLIYSVVPRMKKYELLPVSAAAKARKEKIRLKRQAANAPAEIFTQAGTANLPPAEPTQPVKEPHILDRLNVREAYTLYLELHKMFNPAPVVS